MSRDDMKILVVAALLALILPTWFVVLLPVFLVAFIVLCGGLFLWK